MDGIFAEPTLTIHKDWSENLRECLKIGHAQGRDLLAYDKTLRKFASLFDGHRHH
jgi:hypothetical protein